MVSVMYKLHRNPRAHAEAQEPTCKQGFRGPSAKGHHHKGSDLTPKPFLDCTTSTPWSSIPFLPQLGQFHVPSASGDSLPRASLRHTAAPADTSTQQAALALPHRSACTSCRNRFPQELESLHYLEAIQLLQLPLLDGGSKGFSQGQGHMQAAVRPAGT